MRGGVRLPALIVTLGLLAGCSNPAGAARKETAVARKKSPSPRQTASHTTATQHPRTTTAAWWQPAGTTRTSHGLRVKTGALRGGHMKVLVTDVTGHASRLVTAAATPRALTVGGFALTGLKVSRSQGNARYGIGFHYHHG